MQAKQTILDRYEIASELDRNPHTVVHLAHDCRDDRDVMLRTIELSDELSPETREAFLTRILREAGRTEGFSHPGVVTVYEVDESPDGEATHISMEYVPGPNLAELIASEGALSPDWAFTMAENLGDALQSAHQAGMTLPNLEPAAIVVHESEGIAKIAAAGVAYVAASDPEAPDVVLRNSAYTAPECIRGRESDLRSDLFSLAAILYEALCGRHPFLTDDNEPAQTAILDGSPVPITERASDLAPALNELFEQALAGDPDSRFQNAGEFRKAIHDARREQRLFAKRGVAPKSEPVPESEPETESAFVLELQEADAEFLAAPLPETADEPIEPELSPPVVVSDGPVEETPAKPQSPRRPPTRQKAAPRAPVETEPEGRRTQVIVAAAVVVLILLTVAGWKFFGGASSESVAQNAGASIPAAGDVGLSDTPALKVSEPQLPAPVIAEPVEPPAPKIEKTVKPAPKKQSSKPKPKPAKPAPVVATPTAVAEPEVLPSVQPEPPVPAAPAPAAIKMSLKSGIKSGSLVIWVDGERIYTTELASGSKRLGRMAKKAVGKGKQVLEAQFDLQPGTHQIDVQVNTAKGKRFEKTLNVDLEAGAQRNLQIIAGKTFGDRLVVELD